MKVKFSLAAKLWLSGIEIEADSEEEAKEKLEGMDLDEIMEAGAYCEDIALDDVSDEVQEYSFTAHVTDIGWDITEDDLIGTDFDTVEELKASLPKEMDITIKDLDNYLNDWEESEKDAISDEIFNQTHYLTWKNFNYTITEKF